MNPKIFEKTLELLQRMFAEAKKRNDWETAFEVSECMQVLRYEYDTIRINSKEVVWTEK